MSLIIFILAVVVSFIIVLIGGIAFELTGLKWSIARFQSLSCFTNTGFTTKEAGLIVMDPQRRRIATILMVLGHAGFIALVATFAHSLNSQDTFISKLEIPFIDLIFPPRLVPLGNILFMVICAYLIYKIFTQARFARILGNIIKKRILKRKIIRPVSFEELIVATGGYGILRIKVQKNSSLIDKTLSQAKLVKSHNAEVLTIDRDEQAISFPPESTSILLGDELICYGKLDEVRNKLHIKTVNLT